MGGDVNARLLKHHDMSSELFGSSRMEGWDDGARGDVQVATTSSFLNEDSTIARTHNKPEHDNAHQRFVNNLHGADAAAKADTEAAPAIFEPAENPRRQKDAYYSDIFGQEPGAYQPAPMRAESCDTHACSWLDARSEVARRNLEHHRTPADGESGAVLVDKEFHQSRVFEKQQGAAKPARLSADVEQRAMWDTTDHLTQEASIARDQRTGAQDMSALSVEGHTCRPILFSMFSMTALIFL